MIDSLVSDVGIVGVLLDRHGMVVKLSRSITTAPTWDHSLLGVRSGEDYLRNFSSADPQFIEINRGIKDLLDRRIDFFCTLYWSATVESPAWYILAAFPVADERCQTAVLFIDIARVFHAATDLSAMMIGRGEAASRQIDTLITSTVRRAIADALSHERPAVARTETRGYAEQAMLAKLSKAEFQLVGLLASGLTNTQIAERRKVTLNTVKTQVAAVIHKLGLSNRTQVALFAARNHITVK